MSVIAPPFGLHPSDSSIPTAASAGGLSGAELEKMLEELDVASLEVELARLQNALKRLQSSNEEIKAFLDQEQQENPQAKPDPDFVLAIEENVVVMNKYERSCTAIRNVLRRKHEAHGSTHYNDPPVADDGITEQSSHQSPPPPPTTSSSSAAAAPSTLPSSTATVPAPTPVAPASEEAPSQQEEDQGLYL
ncbi:hypothetical protein BGW42_004956 [Actinomortierella wolfii]|nr:hypothetical protein BGW42_004956 [Actinomortierella wolfii]